MLLTTFDLLTNCVYFAPNLCARQHTYHHGYAGFCGGCWPIIERAQQGANRLLSPQSSAWVSWYCHW